MLEIFQYDFMVRAFIAGMITAVVGPMIGMFLVVRRYSLMADTLAHVSLLGVAVGLLTKLYPLFTAMVVSVIAAIGMEKLRESKKVFGESVLALFLSGGLALAIVLISVANGFNANLFSYLFGSITTVSPSDIYMMVPMFVITAAAVLLFYKELFLISLDDELARVSGIRVSLLNYTLMALAALAVSLSMRIVGVLLISALMVIPVITAMQLGMSFKRTLALSIVISVLSVIAGLFASYYLSLASGGTIVVVMLIVFGVTAWATRKK